MPEPATTQAPTTPATPPATQTPAAQPGNGAPAGAAATPPATTQPAAQPATEQTVSRLVAENRKIQKELRDLKARDPDFKRLTDFEAALKDPARRWEAIEAAGITYEDYTAHKLKAAGHDVGPKLPPEVEEAIEAERAERKKLADKLAEKEASEAKLLEQQQTRRAIDYLTKLTESSGERFELVHSLAQHGEVLQEFIRQREETGEDPDENAVADAVEKRVEKTITEQLKALAAKPKGRKLIESILGTKTDDRPEANQGKANGKGEPQKPPVTNGLSAERGGDTDFSRLTDKQKRERALAASKAKRSA